MVVGMSKEQSAFICRVSVELHVHVVVECMVRDMHFAVIEVDEVKRASDDTLPVTTDCTASKTEGALPSISAYLTTLSNSDY